MGGATWLFTIQTKVLLVTLGDVNETHCQE